MTDANIVNINTLSADIKEEFDELNLLAQHLGVDCYDGQFAEGFKAGVKSLQTRFLKEFPGVQKEKK